MKKIIFVLLILLIIIFIYILLLKKEKYKNKEITNLKNVRLYGFDININSKKNLFDVDNICIYTNDNDKQCLDLNVPKNKVLPRQKGSDGICNDDDCTVCRCPNGRPADKNSTPSCNKISTDFDKVQCKACNIGYKLSNVRVPGSQFSKRSCLPCLAQDNVFQDQSHHMGGCSQCGLGFSCPDTHKLVECGFKSRGRCVKKECKCTNGKAMEECENDDEQSCKSCNAGYYLKDSPVGSMECVAVEPGKQWQPNDNHVGSPQECKSCPVGKSYISKSCTPTSNSKCTQCYTGAGCSGTAAPRVTGYSCTAELNGPICAPCLDNTCPPGQWATEYSCNDGPTCEDYTSCPLGNRSTGTATSDRVCKEWKEIAWQSTFSRNGPKSDGYYNNAWIDSIGKDGNLYSYVVYGGDVWFYRNWGRIPHSDWRGPGDTDWLWTEHGGYGQQIKFFGGTMLDGDVLHCTKHGLAHQQSDFAYSAGYPNVGNNGICDSGSGSEWSGNDTRIRRLHWVRRILQ